jgi:holo-[acyl-carrier protein] synthase
MIEYTDIKQFGIGTDIENIDRFTKYANNREHTFLKRVYTDKELDYCFSLPQVANHLAARYAGKEAIIKALASAGIATPKLNEIEIVNNKAGVPEVELINKKFKVKLIKISLSHCSDKATAFAVVLV